MQTSSSQPSGRQALRLWTILILALAFAPTGAFAQTKFVAFGSSITEGVVFDDCECQCAEECGYPRRLEQRLRQDGLDVTVVNRGLGGERTPAGLTRIDMVLDEEQANVLLLMEGTNDITRISRETTIFNLNEMARKARSRGMTTIHTTLIPRAPGTPRDPDNILNARMAQAIRELAFEQNRQLVDPFEVLSAIPNLFEIFYGDEIPDDVGHPNPQGYDLLASVFYDAIVGRDRVPPVLGPVFPQTESEEVSPLARIELALFDFGSGIDLNATRLRINGSEVTFSVTGQPRAYSFLHLPSEPLGDPVTVTIETRDLSIPPNATTQEVTNFTLSDTVPEPCVPDEITLCLDHRPDDRRFAVQMSWQTALNGGLSGDAAATPLSSLGFSNGGLLSFFENNPEALIKVLDGCAITDNFWVFGAAATTLGFDLTVIDTLARLRGALNPERYTYEVSNTDGNSAAPFFDTQALDTCFFNE